MATEQDFFHAGPATLPNRPSDFEFPPRFVNAPAPLGRPPTEQELVDVISPSGRPLIAGPASFRSLEPLVGAGQFTVAERRGAFSLGLSTGYHQSLANWGTAFRLGFGVLGRKESLEQADFEARVGDRDLAYTGQDEFETEQLIQVYDREHIIQLMNERGQFGISDQATNFLGAMVSSLIDPVAVGSTLATFGLGAVASAATVGGRIASLQRARKAINNMPIRASLGANTVAGIAATPFDATLMNQQGNREYTIEDFAITVAASAALGTLVTSGVQFHKRARERAQRSPLFDNDIELEELETLGEWSVESAADASMADAVDAYKTVRNEDISTIDTSQRPGVDAADADAKAVITAKEEAAGKRSPGGTVESEVSPLNNPELKALVDQSFDFHGDKVKFTDPIDAALYKIHTSDFNEARLNDAEIELVRILNKDNRLGDMPPGSQLRQDIHQIAGDMVGNMINKTILFADNPFLKQDRLPELGGSVRLAQLLNDRGVTRIRSEAESIFEAIGQEAPSQKAVASDLPIVAVAEVDGIPLGVAIRQRAEGKRPFVVDGLTDAKGNRRTFKTVESAQKAAELDAPRPVVAPKQPARAPTPADIAEPRQGELGISDVDEHFTNQRADDDRLAQAELASEGVAGVNEENLRAVREKQEKLRGLTNRVLDCPGWSK